MKLHTHARTHIGPSLDENLMVDDRNIPYLRALNKQMNGILHMRVDDPLGDSK